MTTLVCLFVVVFCLFVCFSGIFVVVVVVGFCCVLWAEGLKVGRDTMTWFLLSILWSELYRATENSEMLKWKHTSARFDCSVGLALRHIRNIFIYIVYFI